MIASTFISGIGNCLLMFLLYLDKISDLVAIIIHFSLFTFHFCLPYLSFLPKGMEGFFRELHHFVTFTPSVERKVDERTRHLINNWRTPKSRGIDTQVIEYE